MLNRRHCLHTLASLPLALHGSQLYAAPAAGSKLLLVFLRGGYDAASLLVPISSSFYYEARPQIAIAKPGPEAHCALPLNSDWGLHPALRESLYPYYQRQQLAFIPFAGTSNISRSHFETQDHIEMGQADTGRKNYQSGFLNRLASVLEGSAAMAFTPQLPLIFQGPAAVANTSLKSISKSSVNLRQSALIAAMYKDSGLETQVAEGFAVQSELLQEMNAEMQAANRNAISTKGFALEVQRMARLMKDRYNLGFMDVGGWDTHVNQGAATGTLANRLGELGQGLDAFAQGMGADWKNTTVVVLSEFGRTFRQNGNRGTDHGHGSVYWVLGGGVKGGNIAGEQVFIKQDSLFQNRDYPVLNDYRAVLGGLLQAQFGLNARQLDTVFPGVGVRDLGLL